MEPSKLKAAVTYNAAADHFDDSLGWDRYGERTVERLKLAPGATVLGVGCGSGKVVPAARKVDPKEVQVIGVDLADRLADWRARKLPRRSCRTSSSAVAIWRNSIFDLPWRLRCRGLCLAIFFVPDMKTGPEALANGAARAAKARQYHLFTCSSGSAAWWAAMKTVRPDLQPTVSPVGADHDAGAAVRQLPDGRRHSRRQGCCCRGSQQPLRSLDDWWTIVLGSGYRWTNRAMDSERRRVSGSQHGALPGDWGPKSVELNVIYALAKRHRPSGARAKECRKARSEQPMMRSLNRGARRYSRPASPAVAQGTGPAMGQEPAARPVGDELQHRARARLHRLQR